MHLWGWHNEPCPQLNLPLPLPAASELPAGLFLFPFCLYSQVVHSQCWHPLLETSPQADRDELP